MDYDAFQVGDKVWSEAYGFGIVVDLILEDSVKCRIDDERYIAFTEKGKMRLFEHRPRTFFHAVADGDVGMRAAIARGAGLKRPVPRGRWEIQPGDRVMVYTNAEFIVDEAKENADDPDYPIAVRDRTYTRCGMLIANNPYPKAMRLYDGEKIFKDYCENMRWMMDEAIKFGWYEKYGKK